jgi:hypothetical protein
MLLKERRRKGDLIEAFKIIRGINKMNRKTWSDIDEEIRMRPIRQNREINKIGDEETRVDVIRMKKAKTEL